MGRHSTPDQGRRGEDYFFRCTRLTVESRGIVHPVSSVPRKRVRLSCLASPSRPEFCERDIASLCVDLFKVFCGQDQAHLPNERISLLNLRKGKAVIERFLSAVGNE